MNNLAKRRESERGSAGTKFLMIVIVLGLAANAGFNYVPVAYDAENLKSEMSTAVLQGLAMPGKLDPVDNVRARIVRAAKTNDIPADAIIDVKQNGNIITAHVMYTKQINLLPFGAFKYNYKFDHTATPSGFLLKQ
jgi:hypothetical protein